ncbi:MAG: DUF1345 domain-containing protein [Methyloceanibacter sp.]
MAHSTTSSLKRWPKPVRIVLVRPRLFLSILAGFGVAAVLPLYVSELRGVTRFLVGWDVGVGLYLVLALRMVANSGIADIHREAMRQDEGSFAILLLTIVSAAASVGAMIAWLELATRAEAFAPAGLVLMLLTIILSWSFIQIMFALHYAYEYYATHEETGGGLIFPHDPEPTYWDFIYFAFAIGTSTQVSDVEVTSKRIRRTVTAHGMVAFFFNVTVIALTVGLVGDAIQN